MAESGTVLFGEGSVTAKRSEMQKRLVGKQLMQVGYSGTVTENDAPLEKLARRSAAGEILARRHKKELQKAKDETDIDSLTGLLNKKGFERQLQLAIETAQRYNSTFYVLVGDLDRFKTYNDTAGHKAGDHVLRSVGTLVQGVTRDPSARWGGDEFAILILNDDPQRPGFVAERLGIAFDKYSHTMGAFADLGMSLGVVSYSGNEFITPDELFDRADIAMTHAKLHSGRTKLVVWEPGMERALMPAAQR